MARLGRANEIVVSQPEFGGEFTPLCGQCVAIVLRAFTFRLRGLLDFLAVLVKPGEVKNLLAQGAVRAGDHIGDDFFVGVPQVGRAVRVVNRRGDVKAFTHREHYAGREQNSKRQSSLLNNGSTRRLDP